MAKRAPRSFPRKVYIFQKICKNILDNQSRLCYNNNRRRERKENIGDLCNGSTTDSDSVCEGSNPSSPAIKKDILMGVFFCTNDNEEGFEGSVVNDCRWQSEPTTAPTAVGQILHPQP